MSVSLTNLPLPWVAAPSLVDYGGDQAPALGGANSRFTRVGSRWSVKFSSLPDLAWSDAQPFLAARLAAQAAGQTVSCPWPQLPFATAIGAPVVSFGGLAGNTLTVSGLTASTSAIVTGLWFSMVVGGRNYLYQVATNATADAGGNATLQIAPWIRGIPAGGEALNFATPVIEGFIDGPGLNWTLTMESWVGLPAFTITEIQ